MRDVNPEHLELHGAYVHQEIQGPRVTGQSRWFNLFAHHEHVVSVTWQHRSLTRRHGSLTCSIVWLTCSFVWLTCSQMSVTLPEERGPECPLTISVRWSWLDGFKASLKELSGSRHEQHVNGARVKEQLLFSLYWGKRFSLSPLRSECLTFRESRCEKPLNSGKLSEVRDTQSDTTWLFSAEESDK